MFERNIEVWYIIHVYVNDGLLYGDQMQVQHLLVIAAVYEFHHMSI